MKVTIKDETSKEFTLHLEVVDAKNITSATGSNTSVTINFTKPSGGCFAEGTLITLADGTQKRIDEVTFEEWQAILTEMIECLDIMNYRDDRCVIDHDGSLADAEWLREVEQKRDEARERFFELYGKWFWHIVY